ncbi:hypothetical protein GCM10007415_35390 [Parapedobacter pyrenivorans]|uniref:histidine kinase n=1 Tax=Parapedobacter pyrenivorans TaxID=1305674 RepID=A0A917HZ33_9SPHI|nr:response regulator [Parapedobacter pyrenivorans]GGG97017.1 hypothetical protein GCM10007415_35390 [Parapedobacter pyrenivorans]
MKLSIAQRLYLGLTIGYVIVITVGILSYFSYQKQIRQAAWVQHTQQVLRTSGSLTQLMTQMENSKRNLFVTDNPRYIFAFDTTVRELKITMTNLMALVHDNPTQRSNAQQIERSLNQVVNYWQQETKVSSQDTALLRQTIRTGTGLMASFTEDIDRFEKLENNLLLEREKRNERSSQQAIAMLFGGLALILVIVSILSYQVYHELTARVKSQRQLKQSLRDMEALNTETSQQNWQLSGLSKINNLLQGQYYADVSKLAAACTAALAELLQIPSAILYRYEEDQRLLVPIGAFAPPTELPPFHRLGVGITGQAAQAKAITEVNNLPPGSHALQSGLGSIQPTSLVLIPLWVDEQLIGLLELIGLTAFDSRQIQLLDLLKHNLGSALQSVMAREHLEELVRQISEQKEELESTQEVLTEQASALAQSSRYKSEFLANMSHELRTPLNSILILANLLAENKDGRLTDKQREYSTIIHKSGSDLLSLINDILDLSKIEAGKIDLNPEEVPVSTLLADMEDLFRHVATERQIHFSVENQVSNDLRIFTDKKRTEQILKNLLSNALKFTPADGKVSLTVKPGERSDKLIFAVKDNGAGIAKEYQSAIFEAFQQADGATNRKYGGTGLGLSISRQLAEQLGGSITLSSELGIGSEFILYLPITGPSVPVKQVAEPPAKLAKAPSINTGALAVQQQLIPDDRHKIQLGDRILLIIEDDENFATILRDFARGKNYQTIVALNGEEGLYCARKYKPAAVLLDIHLPGLSGTEILDTLKRTPELAHIPVHVITSHDDLGHLANEIAGVTIKPFEIGELEAIFERLDVGSVPPPISPTLPEAAPSRAPRSSEPNMAPNTDDSEANQIRLDGSKILLVDDDMRNVYALTAMLEAHGADVTPATNGAEALEQLAANPSIHLVIMDIMMPVMDGYETLQEIRKNPDWSHIPTIAISAKAMAGDRQKAIDAGASDYLTKPIDRNKLLTLLHNWLPQQPD